MAEYMLHHTHKPEECERIFPELSNAAPQLKGSTFFCSCPSGDHGGFFRVEAGSGEEALNQLPAALRSSAKAYAGETMQIP